MADKCVVDTLTGKNHLYAYCIKPLGEMIDNNKVNSKSNANNLVGVIEGGKAFYNYTKALVNSPQNAISDDCNGVLGNRYLLKTNVKCSNGQNVHKYINNIEDFDTITQRYSNNLGILPAAITSATKINAKGLFDVFTDDAFPKCKRVRVPCHVVDAHVEENNYTGLSNWVYITEKDFNELVNKGIIHSNGVGKFIDGKSENFQNLYESINTYLQKYPYLYKTNLQHPNDIKLNNINQFNNDPIIEIYYILLSLFLLFLLYKFINKK